MKICNKYKECNDPGCMHNNPHDFHVAGCVNMDTCRHLRDVTCIDVVILSNGNMMTERKGKVALHVEPF